MERTPKLVNPEHFKKKDIPLKKGAPFWNINLILLVLFLGFFVFFLINCKSGIFENIDLNPVPYSMTK